MTGIVADGKGVRDKTLGKSRYDLIPPEFMDALAKHYERGALKYADRNWERGMSWGRCFTSLMRHAWKWFAGRSYDDPDPAMEGYAAHHMVAAAWNAIACYTYDVRRIGQDDRPVHALASAELRAQTERLNQLECGVQASSSAGTPQSDPPNPAPFTYWYLATPYTHFPAGHTAACLLACRLAAVLMRARVPVFSPIAHSHPIAEAGLKDVKVDHDFWMRADAPMMNAASGLIVVMAESWEKSKGMAEEIKRFTRDGKPVVYWHPVRYPPDELTRRVYPKHG